MTKPWREVAQSDGFLALSPEEQGTARLQYFSSVVAPLVPQSERDAVLQRFLADTASLQRGPADESDPLMRVASSIPNTAQPTFTASPMQSGSVLEGVEIPYDPAVGAYLSRRANAEPPAPTPTRRETFVTQGGRPEARSAVRAAADLALGTYSGAVGLAKGVADNVNAGDNPASEALAMVQAGARRLQSGDLRDQQIKREAQILNAQRSGGELAAARAAFQSLFSQPAAGLDVVAQGAGSLLPILALGAAGASPALMATVNAAANAGSGASDTSKALKALPATVWAESPAYAEIVRRGASHEQAVALLAPVMATPAQLAGAVTGYISGRTGLERTIGQSARVAGNTAGDRSMRAAAELFGEQLETAAPQMTGNVAVGALDGRRHLTQGMGQGAVDTLAGTVVGAGVAARRVAPQVQDAPRLDPVPEILNAATVDDAIGAAARALSAPPPAGVTTDVERSRASDLQLPEEAADVSAGTEVRSADGWAPPDGGPVATPGFSAGGERTYTEVGGVPAGDARRAEPGDAREDDGPRGGRAAEIEAIARRITELEAQSDGTLSGVDANEAPSRDAADPLPADLAVGNPAPLSPGIAASDGIAPAGSERADTRALKAAHDTPPPVWTKSPSGTLSVQGDGRVIRDILNRAGVTTYIPVRGGLMVGLSQADRADTALRNFAAARLTAASFQATATPGPGLVQQEDGRTAGAPTALENFSGRGYRRQSPMGEAFGNSTTPARKTPGQHPPAATHAEQTHSTQNPSDAPLTIAGKPKELLKFLQDNGVTSVIPTKGGVKVGRSQARRARQLMADRNARQPALGELVDSTSRGESLTVAGASRPLESGLAAAALQGSGVEPGRAAGAADQQITAAQGAKATERERIAAMREAAMASKEAAAAKAERRKAEMEKARGKNPRSPESNDKPPAADVSRRGEVSDGEAADVADTEGKATGRGIQRYPSAAATNDAPSVDQRGAQDQPSLKTEPRPTGKIEDFGEKLEGARKDYAALLKDARALDVAVVPLSQSWPEPDYAKLLAGGADPYTVAFIHAARDEVPTKPQKSWKLKGWTVTVTSLRDMASRLLSGEVSKDKLTETLARDDFRHLRDALSGRVELYQRIGHEQSLKGVRVSAGSYSVYRGQNFNPPKTMWTVEKAAKASAFSNWPNELAIGDTREQAIQAFVDKMKATPATAERKTATFDLWRENGKAHLGKKLGREYVTLKVFDDVKAAREYRDGHLDDLTAALDKYKSTPYERGTENAPRVGADHRGGARMTPEVFNDTFGFRGVQFGNYVENSKRQQDLNDAYDSLMDMAAVLGVPPRALSLDGQLGLAFGARGKGGKNAPSAHFEPDRIVINLTKEGGAGSLAHEWFHAADNYFARLDGGRGGHMTQGDVNAAVRPEMREAFAAIRKVIGASGMRKRSLSLDARRNKPYWSTPHEMAARAFEAYAIAKLQDQNAANDYLANIVSEEFWKAQDALLGHENQQTYPYPTQQEMGAIREAFDNFFRAVGTKDTDSGVAMFSKGETAPSGLTPSAFTAAIAEAFGPKVAERLESKGVVVPLQDQSSLPDHVVPFVREGDTVFGFFDPKTDRTYAVLESLTPEMVKGLVLHEVGVHYGFEQMLGREKYANVMKRITVMGKAGNKQVIAARDQAQKNASAPRQVPEETLAYLVQSNPEMRVVREVLAAIKAFLFKTFGIGGRYLTVDDMTALAKAAVLHSSRTEPGTRAPDFAKFLRVFHGTPHEFDRFDMGKVGTGEGVQAYGFGLYFAGRKEVADYYRRTLSEQAGTVGGKPINQRNPLHIAAGNLYAAKGDKAAAVAELREALANLRLYPDGAEPIYREAVRLLESGEAIPEYKPVKGNLYEVEIPEEGSYLLWDEPLSKQPEAVKNGLAAAEDLFDVPAGNPTGEDVYRAAQKQAGGQREASSLMQDAGIAGIKYMDGASRNRPLRELKREFLKELPQDADFDEVTDLFGTGTFSPANEAILKELQANDWLGFDYPAQAVSAALGGELANFDASPALVHAVADAQQGATFNYVLFDHSAVKIEAAFSRRIGQPPAPDEAATWEAPEATKADKILYETQDGRIDLKRAQEAIRESGRQIEERFDARLAETLYPGRVAYRTQLFLQAEVKPLLQFMALNKVGLAEIGDFLLARHALERNAQVASVNPKMADGGAGRNSKGDLMTTEAAEEYLAALDPRRRKVFESVAARVDAITAGTRKLLVDEGLEKADVVRAWESAYKHYAPLHKDEVQAGTPHPIGTGFSVKGAASKRAIGSTKEVTNVLGHVLMQREAALTRAEKNRVGLSLYGLVLSHPNPGFWTVIRPGMSGTQIAKELAAIGVDPDEAEASMEGVPTIRGIDQATGQVVDRPNPLYKNLPGAITLKLAGEDRVVMLNVQNERGLRLAASMKNLDGLTGFDLAGSIVGQATRWIASVSTRYNPVFGLVNVIRDTQNGVVNLTNTALADKKAEILGNVPAALVGIARDLRNDAKRTEWSDLFNEFQEAGGQTGYRDIFRDAGDRTKAIEHELKQLRYAGMLTPGKAAHAVLDLLDGFNTALENAVRLSAYKAGIDSGLSGAEAARIGRELTVDFNRKGRIGREIGPLYAFANASLQGAARTFETLRGPAGAKIIAGGVGLGVLQALMLAAAGYDEDDIPEFVKTRSLIIPTGWHSHAKNYIAIPYGLGMHVLPNTGRVLTELALSGGKDLGEKVFGAVGEIASAFNPLGGGNIFTADGALKTLAPTVVDPVIELIANRNFAGGQIERKPFNEEGDNRPGSARARESTQRSATGQVYLSISKALNSLTGGNEFEAGAVSPTPERVRYITMTIGGGVMRELEKTVNAAVDTAAGRPVKANALPLTGRFFGEVDRDAVEQARFFEAKNKINKLHSSLKAAEKAGDREAYRRILREHPEVEYYDALSETQRSVSALNKLAAETINNPERLKQIDAERVREMQALNKALRRREQTAPTPADRLRALTE